MFYNFEKFLFYLNNQLLNIPIKTSKYRFVIEILSTLLHKLFCELSSYVFKKRKGSCHIQNELVINTTS